MRLKASELRIGNYVDYFSDNADRWINSKQVTSNDIECIEADKGDHAEGVKINATWLEAFGFKEVPVDHPIPNHRAFENDFSFHVKIYNQTGLPVKVWYKESVFDFNFRYVHEVQNICFTVTGQELELAIS